MENKSVSNKVSIFQIILCIAVVALIITVIIQARSINSLNNKNNDVSLAENVASEINAKGEATVDPLPAPVKTDKTTTAKAIGAPAKEPDLSDANELEYQLGAAEEELDMAIGQLSDELSKKKEFQKATAQLQKNILSDPALKKTLRDALKLTMDNNYDPLSERSSLNSFIESVPSEQRISGSQRESLINSMYDARKTVQAEMGPEVGISTPADLTGEKLSRLMERQALVNERYVEVCQGILPSAQVEQYKAFLKQRLDMTESTLKMSLHINGGKTN